MIYEKQVGVPKFECNEFSEKSKDYCVLIPVINEGERIHNELTRAFNAEIYKSADIAICDGGSTDGSMEHNGLKKLQVNALLIKQDAGRQGAQLRMGMFWALKRGYKGIITIDGNDKDSIEDVPKGGVAINTPLVRLLAVRFIHAPLISLTAGKWFTDTTNAYRGYSAKYLQDQRVMPLRDVFSNYELLAYLSVRATQLGMKTCEIPVARVYPSEGKTPTKISAFKGNFDLLSTLFKNLFGLYEPKDKGTQK